LQPPQFWQRRFHDFNVWNHKKKIEKLSYMHMNPVKRRLTTHPQLQGPHPRTHRRDGTPSTAGAENKPTTQG
jgi:hypothetical protein